MQTDATSPMQMESQPVEQQYESTGQIALTHEVQPLVSLLPLVHWLCAQAAGGLVVVQTLLVHAWPVAQLPQDSVPPQPSPTEPQFLPSAEQLVGAQLGAPHAVHMDLPSLAQIESQEKLQQ